MSYGKIGVGRVGGWFTLRSLSGMSLSSYPALPPNPNPLVALLFCLEGLLASSFPSPPPPPSLLSSSFPRGREEEEEEEEEVSLGGVYRTD